MIATIQQALRFAFMRNALAAGLLVSVACGVIGTYVVVNRIVFISGGIAHAAYGGIGLSYLLGFDAVLGAIGFSLLASMIMGMVQRRTDQRSDTVIGALWAVGMALGIIFIDLTRGYNVDLMSYLFGSILAVPHKDLMLMLVLDVVIIVTVIALYKELLAMSFDQTYASVVNVPVDAVYLLLLAMIALTVVMMMRVVGLIMVIAMLTMPAAIAGMLTHDMKKMMILASLLGMVFTTMGLGLAYSLNLTSGAAIILVAASAYLLSLVIKRLVVQERAT